MYDAPVPRQTLEEYYSGSRLLKLTTSESLQWNNARLEIAHHAPISELSYSPYLGDDVLSFLLAGTAQMDMHISGGKTVRASVGPGSLQLLPRQTVYGAKSKWNSDWTYGALQLNRGMVVATAAALLHSDPENIELVPTYGFNDPVLYHLGIELTRDMQYASPHSTLYTESLTNRLTLHLLRHYSTGRIANELSRSRLTTMQLRKVDEYIYANLDQKIFLADLAACLHLSVPHFERMFRTTTHVPPYRYVLEIRLERARVLLQRTRLTIAEVALQCGFYSQSHFTAHFKRYVGVAPARFARNVRE